PFNFSLYLICYLRYHYAKKSFEDTDFSSATTSVSDHDKKRVKDTDVYSAISVIDNDSDLTDSILSEEDVTKFKAKVTYKINDRGLAMALDDKDNYDAFIIECQKLVKSNKSVNSIEEFGNSDIETLKIKTKKLKTDFVLKESKLNANEIEIAVIIIQIRTKYNCQIYAMLCYIEDDKHLLLISSCLHL
ncbi:13734_t:CDS:2, partial [Cetraspora pellucida]